MRNLLVLCVFSMTAVFACATDVEPETDTASSALDESLDPGDQAACKTDDDCTTRHCLTSTGVCVQCTQHSHCGMLGTCSSNVCVP